MSEISKLKPLGKRLVIELECCEEEKSGIILPGARDKIQNQGKIISTYKGCELQVGQKVIFEELNEDSIFEEDGKKIALINEEHIIAKVEEEEIHESK